MLVVDTCVLIDVADADPAFGAASANCLATHLREGLVISPITYVEMAPVFDDSARLLEEFLAGVGVSHAEVFDARDRAAAFAAWGKHVAHRRAGRTAKRPVADALIGATAMRFDGLITRNETDFKALFPTLALIVP